MQQGVGASVIRQERIIIRQNKAFRACLMLLAFLASWGHHKTARAGAIKDIPARIQISATQDFQKAAYYPSLLASKEKTSSDLKAFTKWQDMFKRFEAQLNQNRSQPQIQALKAQLTPLVGLSLDQKINKVNRIMNAKRYITDNKNWGTSDYWATPLEFMQRGGDCEDYAIAKYTALRMLGVNEDQMRIAIVQDTVKNIPHSVLVVYTDNGPKILDNQNKAVVSGTDYHRYRPIYSINRYAWWYHMTKGTRVASAR